MELSIKIFLFCFIVYLAWYFGTAKIRYANAYFGEIQRLKNIAFHLRSVNRGFEPPNQFEEKFKFMTRHELELEIREMFVTHGFPLIAESEYSKYMKVAKFKVIQLPYSNEDGIIYFNDNQEVSPSPAVNNAI